MHHKFYLKDGTKRIPCDSSYINKQNLELFLKCIQLDEEDIEGIDSNTKFRVSTGPGVSLKLLSIYVDENTNTLWFDVS